MPTTTRRCGKIARLPAEIRHQINSMLSDGIPYPAIAKKIAATGHRLNNMNISRWFSGGYQDWLKHQDCLDELRARLDSASQFLQADSSQKLDQASLRLAVLRLYGLLTDFNPAVLKPKIANHPGIYARLLSVLCKLTDSHLRLERDRRIQLRPPLLSPALLASILGSPPQNPPPASPPPEPPKPLKP